jgi:hypothetical protein
MANNRVQVIFEVDKDASGRTVLKQIQGSIRGIGSQARTTSTDVDSFLKAFKVALVLDFFKSGAVAAFEFGKTAVNAFNEAQAAALGLQSVAKFKGFDPKATVELVKNLDLVKSGLLTVGEASTTLKNLLQSGFTLDQSIELIKRFGDSAAFGRQAALTFGQAVVSTSEGIRNQNSILSDNGGITKNLSVILKERGFELQDLSDKVKGASAREALYNGLLVETNAQLGDAAKRAATFAGGQDKLAATQKTVLETVGKLITENPALNDSFRELGKSLEIVNSILKDSDSELNQLVKAGTTTFASLVRGTAELLRNLEGIVGLIRDIANITTIGGSESFLSKVFPKEDAATREILERAKKFSEAFNEARKPKPLIEGQTKAPFAAGEKDLEALKKFIKESEEKAKKFDDAVKGAGDTILGLQAKLQVNPIVQFYEAAQARQRDFIDKFKEVPEQMKAAFERANRDVLALDLFKGALGAGQALSNTRRQLAELEAGGDPEKLARARREAVQQEIEQAKRFLDIAANPAQRQLAIGRIVEATNNISELTPEQRDIRFRALNEQQTVQEQLFRENFNRLTAQTNATNDNTAALVQVGNRLTQVEGALSNFKEGAIIKIVDESNGAATVNLGSV